MIIDGFEKLTLLDYPGLIACIIFTKGCNYNCSFCHNSNLINFGFSNISTDEVLNYLEFRRNILEGIVISGGEPTIQKGLKEFIKQIKSLGYKVKLDTNGSNPDVLKKLIDENLIDYVAMDIKSDFDNYSKVVNCSIDINNVKKSINILKKSNIDFEFRTTIYKELHNIDILKNILDIVGDNKYFIQNFVQSENVRDKSLNGFSSDELELIKKSLNKENIKIR